MPRIRDKRGNSVHELSVSPWMTKKGLKEGAEPKQPAAQAPPTAKPMMYSVVLADAPLMATANRHMGLPLVQQQQHHQHDKQQVSVQLQLEVQQQQQRLASMAFSIPAPVLQQQQQHAQVPASGTAGTGWHQVSRSSRARAQRQNPRIASDQQQQQTTTPPPPPAAAAAAARNLNSTSMLQESVFSDRARHLQQQQQQECLQEVSPPGAAAEMGVDTAPWLDLLLDEADKSSHMQLQALQQQQEQSSIVLRGVAQLVLHPSGSISGHFIATTSNSSNSNILPQQQQQQQPSQQQHKQHHTQHVKQSELQLQQLQRQHTLCLGLQGKQVLGLHSCYRDPEWALLQLSIIKYSSSSSSSGGGGAKRARNSSSGGRDAWTAEEQQLATELKGCGLARKRLCREQQHEGRPQQQQDASTTPVGAEGGAITHPAPAEKELRLQAQQSAAATAAMSASAVEFEAEAWVQRTGGDLVSLQPADMEDEDTAAAVMKDSLGLEPDFAAVYFAPHTLLAGAAADKQLALTWRGLVGSDVVLNLGEMVIYNLPVGMLGD